MSPLSHLRQLESESIHIPRAVVAECQHPVLLRLAQKAFHPGPVPFSLLHIDTGYKLREMIEFRDRYTAQLDVKLIVHTNRAALDSGATPFAWGQRGCGALKTTALLDGLRNGGFDAAIGGARLSIDTADGKTHSMAFSLDDENTLIASPNCSGN